MIGKAHVHRQAPLRRTLLAAALLSIGLHASVAHALGLGPITVQSAIGEPFRGEVSILGGSGDPLPASTCFSLDRPASATADDLPWLTAARIRLLGRTAIISGQGPVNEPVLMVGLRVGCGAEVVREYTVLMQPRLDPLTSAPEPANTTRSEDASRRSAASAKAPVTSAAPASSTETPPVAPRRARSPKPAPAAGGDRLRVVPSIDIGDGMRMSSGLAPRAPATEAQREALRTEQKLLATLDQQIATHLAIADKVKQLEERLAELQKQLDRNSRILDSAGAPPVATSPAPVAAEPVTPLSSPAEDTSAPVDEAQPTEAEDTAAPAITADDEAGREQAPAEPPPGLTNEPVKVITKLPPDAPAEAEAPTGGVNWIVAGLGVLAAAAVLGGGKLLRRRAARLAEASAERQREMEARLAQEHRPRRRDVRSADEDYAHGGNAPLASAAGTPPPHEPPPAPALVVTPPERVYPEPEHVFEGEVVPPMDYVPPSEQVTETPSVEDEKVVAAVSSVVVPITPPVAEAPAASTPRDTVPDLEFTPSAAENVDFDIGQTSSQDAARPARLDLEFDTFVGTATSTGLADKASVPVQGPRLVSSTPSLSIDQMAAPANEEAPPSHEHVLELAEIMMSFGRAEGAAQTLSEFLRDYPQQSLVPWLKLLDLYHKGGRRREYGDLAPELNRAFNVKVPDWDHFTGPETTETVEQFVHIMARVKATWPTQDCLDYLTELLRDNRAGTRIGFPLGAIDDILLLRSVLEWLIANPPITNTSASRLAQL